MEETNQQPTLFKHALRWGAIVGAVGVFCTIMLYVIDYTLMVQFKILIIFLLIYLGMIIYAGIEYRNSVGRYLAYGKAFQHGFLILATSGLIATLFNMLLYHVIDPELPEKLVEASLENARAMMERFGAPPDSIDGELEKAADRTRNQFTFSGQALGYLFILIFSAIIASISSLFVRRNEPVEI